MVETDKTQVLERQLDLAFARLPAVLAAYPIVGLLVWIPLRHSVAPLVVLTWLVALGCVAVAGLFIGRTYHRDSARRSRLRFWIRIRLGSAALNGMIWGGVLASVLYVPSNLLLQDFIIFVVGGTSVAALSSTSSHRPSLFAFQLTNNLPLIGRLIWEGDHAHLAMAALMVAFLLVVLVIGHRLGNNIEQLIRTEEDNARLVVDIRAAHDEVKKANKALSQRVEQRTAQLTVALAEKEAREAQLRQAERMEAVGRLAGGVAHDFNNVLTGITGFANLLYETFDEHDERRADVGEILNAADRASQLTRQLLGFAKGGLTTPKVVDLSAQLLQLDRMLRRVMPNNVELNWILPDEPLWLFLDPGQLDQLVMNLVVNGRDAMPDGGTITVSVERGECFLDDNNAAELTPCAVLRVQDTGQGIAEQLIEHVFEPFVTTKGSQGTGLGLATCFAIVKRAAGVIQVKSSVGKGTVFTVQLPLTKLAEPAKPRPADVPLIAVRRGASILVVEDQPAIQKVVSRALLSQGYKVYQALSAEEALAQVITRGLELDLVLSDVVLPHMSGFDLRDALLSHGTTAKFLMMSGYIDEASLRRKDASEALPLLAKPFSASQLLNAIAEALGPVDTGKVKKGHLRSV